jgi:hypothetical protein
LDSSYAKRKKIKRADENESLEFAKPGTRGRFAASNCLADDARRYFAEPIDARKDVPRFEDPHERPHYRGPRRLQTGGINDFGKAGVLDITGRLKRAA